VSAHNSLLHMQQRLPAAPSPLIVCDVIGSLCAVQFLICSTFVLVVAFFAVWLEMWFIWFQYKATDYVVKEPGKLELVFTPTGGKEHRMEVFTFKDRGGVGMSMYNTDEVKNFSILLLCHFSTLLQCSTLHAGMVNATAILSVCRSHWWAMSEWLNRLSWFWTGGRSRFILCCVVKFKTPAE